MVNQSEQAPQLSLWLGHNRLRSLSCFAGASSLPLSHGTIPVGRVRLWYSTSLFWRDLEIVFDIIVIVLPDLDHDSSPLDPAGDVAQTKQPQPNRMNTRLSLSVDAVQVEEEAFHVCRIATETVIELEHGLTHQRGFARLRWDLRISAPPLHHLGSASTSSSTRRR